MYKCTEPFPTVGRISASRLNTFFRCPRSYQYQSLHRSRLPSKSPSLESGTIVHGMIEKFYKEIAPSLIERGKGDDIVTIRKVVTKMALDEVDKTPMEMVKNKILRSIENFLEFEFREGYRFLGGDVHAELELECPRFHGFLDCYNEKDGIIHDWKTGKFPSDKTKKLQAYRQASVYAHLAREHDLPANKIIFHYLEEGRTLVVDVDAVSRAVGKEYQTLDEFIMETVRIIEYFVENGDLKPISNNGTHPLCNHCDYQVRCQARDFTTSSWLRIVEWKEVEGW